MDSFISTLTAVAFAVMDNFFPHPPTSPQTACHPSCGSPSSWPSSLDAVNSILPHFSPLSTLIQLCPALPACPPPPLAPPQHVVCGLGAESELSSAVAGSLTVGEDPRSEKGFKDPA